MQTINDLTPTEIDLKNSDYAYQTELTAKLDNLSSDFNQEIINEIVLWKVNRYGSINQDSLNLLNQIKKFDTQLDLELTRAILLRLLHKEKT